MSVLFRPLLLKMSNYGCLGLYIGNRHHVSWQGARGRNRYDDQKGAGAMSENEKLEKATFAGGCFWCIEAAFKQLDGVVSAVSGYTGGHTENPTYHEVSSGTTGHYEAVQITFDPSKISYEQLLDFFWRNIDPTDAGGQFFDRGSQYQTAIFYHNEAQHQIAEQSKERLQNSGRFDKPIATAILPAAEFFKAEEYHQDYYKKQSAHYKTYKIASGRERRLEETWREEGMKDQRKSS